MTRTLLLALAAAALLAACSDAPKKSPPPRDASVRDGDAGKSPYPPAQEDPSKRGNYTAGGLYAPGIKDSAPDELPDIDRIPEPEVVAEPRSRYGNRSPYKVLGKSYRVLDSAEGYDETGIASYYGNKFHGRRTSNLEVYDMYAYTAAHKTLPLPSFARVTNIENGKSVVVRVNDRGPFHDGRIIDLSLAAALRIGIQKRGTGRVEVVGLTPGEHAHDSQARQDRDAVAADDASKQAAPKTALPVILAGNGALILPPGVHIATGKPRPAQPSAMDKLVVGLPEGAAVPAAPATGTGVTLQVAAFDSRANAERALSMLQGAGVADAHLQDGISSGKQVWRLRVGPVDNARVGELSERVAGLGFGRPQVVRE